MRQLPSTSYRTAIRLLPKPRVRGRRGRVDLYACGCSSVGRAFASQAKGRAFESRHPLRSDAGSDARVDVLIHMRARALWHASEDPHITVFHPRRAVVSPLDDDVVWAVDDDHVPAYWFPRDCARATF